MRRFLAFARVLLVFGFANYTTHASTHPARSGGADVIHEMNLARQNPGLYAHFVAASLTHFRGNILVLPNGTLMRTREGVGALDEAIRFLQTARPLPPLIDSPGMSAAAAEHVADQASGSYGHAGSDRSSPADRLNRHGSWSTLWGENISYGKSSARDIVLALIVDDGLAGRKHRKNIFNPQFRYAGAAIGPHARYRTMCSIDFAAGYVEKGASPNESLLARN